MSYLLATNPVVPLPKGRLSFNQRPANLVIPDRINGRDRDSSSLHPIYSAGIVAELVISAFEFHQFNSQQPVWTYCPKGVKSFSLFK